MTNKLTMLFLVISAISLGGCARAFELIPKATPIGAACSGFDVIKPSRQDVLTRGTKDQIVVHNTVYRKLCPGAAP